MPTLFLLAAPRKQYVGGVSVLIAKAREPSLEKKCVKLNV